jgi:hypothetical protein
VHVGAIYISAIQYADGSWSYDQKNLKSPHDQGTRPIMLLSDEEDGRALFVPITSVSPAPSRDLVPVPPGTPRWLYGAADCMDLVSRSTPDSRIVYTMPQEYVQTVVARVMQRLSLQ